MEKFKYRFAAWFFISAVVVCAVGVWLRGWDAFAPGISVGSPAAPSDLNGTSSSVVDNSGGSSAAPTSGSSGPPARMIVSGAEGDVVVQDATADYHVSIPSNWYAEKNADSGLTIYPDYNPKTDAAPSCKIEISRFSVPKNTDLAAWLNGYLHADPTQSVTELSRAPIAVDGVTGIAWSGVMNGVTSTLIYAKTSEVGGAGVVVDDNIFEIAESPLSEAGSADDGDCNLALQALVANFHFGSYAP